MAMSRLYKHFPNRIKKFHKRDQKLENILRLNSNSDFHLCLGDKFLVFKQITIRSAYGQAVFSDKAKYTLVEGTNTYVRVE